MSKRFGRNGGVGVAGDGGGAPPAGACPRSRQPGSDAAAAPTIIEGLRRNLAAFLRGEVSGRELRDHGRTVSHIVRAAYAHADGIDLDSIASGRMVD